ncbi:hypothetical protein BKA63DRAFT_589039 [Paraphoma chrysanthemicola]|nr:hypothetical protein BKA63DRAFT_589039 [Paraphoma chrysanthemicola]
MRSSRIRPPLDTCLTLPLMPAVEPSTSASHLINACLTSCLINSVEHIDNGILTTINSNHPHSIMSRPAWTTTHIAAISIVSLLLVISPAAYFYLQSKESKSDADVDQSDPLVQDVLEPEFPAVSKLSKKDKKKKKGKKAGSVVLEEFYEPDEEELVNEGSMQVKGVRGVVEDVDMDVLGGLRGTR